MYHVGKRVSIGVNDGTGTIEGHGFINSDEGVQFMYLITLDAEFQGYITPHNNETGRRIFARIIVADPSNVKEL